MNLFHKCVSSCSKILCNGPNNFHFIRYYNFFFFWPHCAACTILVPWPGIEPMLCAVKAWSLNHWVAREVPNFFFFYSFIYLFTAALGLHFCARAFSSCGKWGPLSIAVRGPLAIAASLVAERRLSNCGSRAQPLRGTWDPPKPGLEPVPPALAGRFPTTAPPGKPPNIF